VKRGELWATIWEKNEMPRETKKDKKKPFLA
jgi:hypothetical protein